MFAQDITPEQRDTQWQPTGLVTQTTTQAAVCLGGPVVPVQGKARL